MKLSIAVPFAVLLAMPFPTLSTDWQCRTDHACRCYGISGGCQEFIRRENSGSYTDCMSYCEGRSTCRGFEWTDKPEGGCEIHPVQGDRYEEKPNSPRVTCCWKSDSTSGGSGKNSKGGSRVRERRGRRVKAERLLE